MTTKLDKLLASIDPDKTLEETFNRADEAINTFDLKSVQIDKWTDFKDCMVRFLQYLDFRILRLSEPLEISESFFWPRCAHMLIDVYGINGEHVAFNMAKTGIDGGLYAVLKAGAMRLAEDYAKNEISALIGLYLQNLTVEEQIAAPMEYVAKYNHLLPPEIAEGYAPLVHVNFTKFLEKHPYIIQHMRLIGRQSDCPGNPKNNS